LGLRVTTALPLTWGVAAAGGRSSSGNGLGMGLGHLSFVGLGRICRLGLSVRLGEELGGAQGAGRQGGVVLVGLSPRLAHDEAVLPQQAKRAGWGILTDGEPTIQRTTWPTDFPASFLACVTCSRSEASSRTP